MMKSLLSTVPGGFLCGDSILLSGSPPLRGNICSLFTLNIENLFFMACDLSGCSLLVLYGRNIKYALCIILNVLVPTFKKEQAKLIIYFNLPDIFKILLFQHVTLATFHAHSSHLWLVTTILEGAALTSSSRLSKGLLV